MRTEPIINIEFGETGVMKTPRKKNPSESTWEDLIRSTRTIHERVRYNIVHSKGRSLLQTKNVNVKGSSDIILFS